MKKTNRHEITRARLEQAIEDTRRDTIELQRSNARNRSRLLNERIAALACGDGTSHRAIETRVQFQIAACERLAINIGELTCAAVAAIRSEDMSDVDDASDLIVEQLRQLEHFTTQLAKDTRREITIGWTRDI